MTKSPEDLGDGGGKGAFQALRPIATGENPVMEQVVS